MDPVSVLVEMMGQCRILDPAQVEEVRRDFAPRHANDAHGLATELLNRDWLTPFQINRLLGGRGPELLQGSYVLLERIGEGGMGQVFKARNWKLGRIVALKLIRKELLTNPTVVARFRREIETTAQLDHPNLIRAFDADQTDDGLFIVMEYVEGIDLARLIKEQGPVSPAKACDYIRQAALGLQYAHERGLVHRDVKPPNLLLSGMGDRASGIEKKAFSDPTSPTVKVLDLGLARLQDAGHMLSLQKSPGLTQTGVILGTVDFIAPEQARDSHSVDIRADLYALGCTFFFLLTGKEPFPGGSPTEKLIKHTVAPLPPLLDVSQAVRAIIHKLMAKKPEDRYQTPAELVVALEQVLAHPERLQLRDSPAILPPTVPTIALRREREPLGLDGALLVRARTERKPKPPRVSGTRPRLAAKVALPPATAPAMGILEVTRPHVVPVPAAPIIAPRARPQRRFRRLGWLCLLLGLGLLGGVLAWPVVFPPASTQGEQTKKPRPPLKPEGKIR